MERLGSLDAVFLAIESPSAPMNIGSVSIFEGPAPALDEIRAAVAARTGAVPRCRQRVREVLGGLARPVWVDDEHFDLRRHVRPVVGGRGVALESIVERLMVLPLDRDRPLWELWVVDDLPDGRWAVVSKVHHCMVDGIAGTDLLAVFLGSDAASGVATAGAESGPFPGNPAVLRFSVGASLRSIRGHVRNLALGLLHPGATTRRLHDLATGARGLWLQRSRRDSPLTGPIGRARRWAHLSVPLDSVTAVRRRLGGTVNDVVLSAVSLGFRSLLDQRGVRDRHDVMALVPVSVRALDARGVLDNRVAVAHALLPVGTADPTAVLRELRADLGRARDSHQTDASTVLLHTGDVVPHVVATGVARAVVRLQRNIETIATNVPGSATPLFLCGRRMTEAYPFAPLAGHIRIAVAIWSYCGMLHLGLTADAASTDDLDVLVEGITDGFARLGAAAAG